MKKNYIQPNITVSGSFSATLFAASPTPTPPGPPTLQKHYNQTGPYTDGTIGVSEGDADVISNRAKYRGFYDADW